MAVVLHNDCMLRRVQLSVTPWTVTLQAPLSMGFSYFRGPGNQVIINTFPACLFGPGVSQKSSVQAATDSSSVKFSAAHQGCSGSVRAPLVALPPSLLSLVTAQNGGHVIWPLSHLVLLTPALSPSLFPSRPHLSLKLSKVNVCPSILSVFCQVFLLPLPGGFLVTALLSFF